MKNNYSLLNKGDENSEFYSSENKSGIQKSKKIDYILRDNFRKFRKNNSAILKDNRTDLKTSKRKYKLITIKHNSFLNDIKKITPKLNLQYEIEKDEQKGRYSVIKNDEIFDENKFNGKNFIKKDYKDSYSYKTCLDLRGKKRFYMSNKKSISYAKFRPSSLNDNTNNAFFNEENITLNNNKYTYINIVNNSIYQRMKKIRPKNSTMSSSVISNPSRPFSGNNYEVKKNIYRNNKQKQYFKNKCIRLKYQIDKTFEIANNASMELNNDIYESKNYDKLNKLEKENKNKKKEIIKNTNININKNKTKKNYKDDLYKYLDIEKNVENKIIKSYKYYDKNGKKILKEAMRQDKMQQHFLNKNENSRNIILNSRFFIKRLQKELGILGSNILATKKKYKGESAIEPNNELDFLHKLIKENKTNNLSDEQYLSEIIKRTNESMSNKIKKRLLSLQQKSLSIKNKIRENDFSYL